MKKLFLIGNLTADPVMRTTVTGVPLCTFTVAVHYKVSGEQKTDYYRISAWRALGQSCGDHLKKGSKVSVIGDIELGTYTGKDGKTYINADVSADQVEFINTPKAVENRDGGADPAFAGFENVDDSELPFA